MCCLVDSFPCLLAELFTCRLILAIVPEVCLGTNGTFELYGCFLDGNLHIKFDRSDGCLFVVVVNARTLSLSVRKSHVDLSMAVMSFCTINHPPPAATSAKVSFDMDAVYCKSLFHHI